MTLYTVPKLETYSADELDRAVSEMLAALQSESQSISDEATWTDFRNRWTARKNGILTQINDGWLKAAPGPQKRDVGQRVNQVKQKVEAVVEETKGSLSGATSDKKLEAERVDVTLPGTKRQLGATHPITLVMDEIVGVFKAMGYSVAEGPEIESDYYNFEALNFPLNHPARDMQDTIFIAGQEKKQQRDRLLLRTHTSPVQIRYMEKHKPPVRVVIPGRVYRNDAPDATHSPMFHQIEGLAVDTNITFCDLKGTLEHAMKMLFGSRVKTKLRPSFFPFTEPSAEVLVTCPFCTKGCRVCKMSGWIELLGAGMVDPALYGYVGYDASKVSGFAFGMGADRLAAMKYGVDDIQLFFHGDVRFLRQFA
jgi:phenylalanyl-tRNA synthetase alpha chain